MQSLQSLINVLYLFAKMPETIDIITFEPLPETDSNPEFSSDSNLETLDSNLETLDSNFDFEPTGCYESPNDTVDIQAVYGDVRFPLSKRKTATCLGITDTSVATWIKNLRKVGIESTNAKGQITETGFLELEKIKFAKEKGISLSEYIASLETKNQESSALAIVEIVSESDDKIHSLNSQLAAVEKEFLAIPEMMENWTETNDKFSELALKNAQIQGFKLGIECAKAKISGMQRAESELLKKLLSEE